MDLFSFESPYEGEQRLTHLPSPPADTEPNNETRNAELCPPILSVDTRSYDPDFYFSGSFVQFETENCLFRVPTYVLAKESNYFMSEFKIPVYNSKIWGDSEPTIVLPADIKRDDFHNFMKALYPTSVQKGPDLSKEEWISVLKLSTKWRYENLRRMTISSLESLLTSLDKITLGRQCFESSWFLLGLREYATSDDTISDDDAIEMDYVTAFKLSRLQVAQSRGRYYYHNDITDDVKTAFLGEWQHIKTEEDKLLKLNSTVVTVPDTPRGKRGVKKIPKGLSRYRT